MTLIRLIIDLPHSVTDKLIKPLNNDYTAGFKSTDISAVIPIIFIADHFILCESD
jgi:hypothetical protein